MKFLKEKRSIIVSCISIAFLFFLIGCDNCKHHDIAIDITSLLTKADDKKFIDYEYSDSILNIVAKKKSIDSLCYQNKAYFYFLKAYISLFKEEFDNSLAYIDSSRLIQNGNKSFIVRSQLTNALVAERLRSYEDALTLYLEIINTEEEINNSERLIAILGAARINYLSQNSYEKYIEDADSLIKQDTTLNKGLFWSNMSILTKDKELEIIYKKKAFNYCYNREKLKEATLACGGIINYYLKNNQLDSVKYYFSKLDTISGGNKYPLAYNFNRCQLFYHRANYCIKKCCFDEADKLNEKGLKEAFNHNRYDVIRALFNQKGNIASHLGETDKALEYYMQALKYEELNFKSLNKDQIKAVKFQFYLKQQEIEIKNLKKDNRIKNLSIWGILTTCIILSFLLFHVYHQWDEIKKTFNNLNKTYKREKIKYSSKVAVIDSIEQTIHNPTKSYSQIYNDINNTLNKSNEDIPIIANSLFQDPLLRQKIHKAFPKISESQFKFVVCLYMEIDSKIIMKEFNLNQDSFKSRKKRLKKKYNIPKGVNLMEYIKYKIK